MERTPVWIMRQAGRYLPEYRAVRKNHSFSEMYKRPDLATEVTLQPIDILGVDAAILFSDILVVPEAMGMELHFSEGKGPQFPNPLRDEAALKALRPVESNQELGFVMEAIRNIRRKGNDDLAALKKDGLAGDDEISRAEKELDAATKTHVDAVDDALKRKEAELLEV